MIVLLSPIVKKEDCILWQRDEKDPHYVNALPEPDWNGYKHPFISYFFYGHRATPLGSVIPTTDFYEAILFLEEQYVIEAIVHIPQGILFDVDQLYQEVLHFEKNKPGTAYPQTLSFLYTKKKFYAFPFGISTKGKTRKWVRAYTDQYYTEAPDRPISKHRKNPAHFILSLGGWCGPAIATRNIFKLPVKAMPFDFVMCPIQTILKAAEKDFEYVLEVEKNILTPHHDWTQDGTKEGFIRRLNRFVEHLEDDLPILFVRGIIRRDYQKTVAEIKRFQKLLKEKYQRGDDRFVLILHDQNISTVKIKMIDPQIMLWAAEGTLGLDGHDEPNIDRNYAKIIEYCLASESWEEDEKQIKKHTIIPNQSWEKEYQQLFVSREEP